MMDWVGASLVLYRRIIFPFFLVWVVLLIRHLVLFTWNQVLQHLLNHAILLGRVLHFCKLPLAQGQHLVRNTPFDVKPEVTVTHEVDIERKFTLLLLVVLHPKFLALHVEGEELREDKSSRAALSYYQVPPLALEEGVVGCAAVAALPVALHSNHYSEQLTSVYFVVLCLELMTTDLHSRIVLQTLFNVPRPIRLQ